MEKTKIVWRNAGEKRDVKAKSINFMVIIKISLRNAGEIPPGVLLEILQLIIKKNEKCVFLLYKHCMSERDKLQVPIRVVIKFVRKKMCHIFHRAISMISDVTAIFV